MRCRGKVDTRAHSYRIIVTPPGWLTWGSVRSWQMRDGAQALELWSQPTGRIGVPQLSYAICRGGRCNNCCERPGKRPPHYKQVELQYSGSATVDSGQARSGRLGIVDARPRRVAMATGARSRGATNCCCASMLETRTPHSRCMVETEHLSRPFVGWAALLLKHRDPHCTVCR